MVRMTPARGAEVVKLLAAAFCEPCADPGHKSVKASSVAGGKVTNPSTEDVKVRVRSLPLPLLACRTSLTSPCTNLSAHAAQDFVRGFFAKISGRGRRRLQRCARDLPRRPAGKTGRRQNGLL